MREEEGRMEKERRREDLLQWNPIVLALFAERI